MLTRRAVLTGTAAASIAAIASAREGAVASGVGFDVGFGALTDGALAGFSKGPDSFGVFMKFQKAGVEVFFKNPAPGVVEVFQKTFFKGWTPMTISFLKLLPSLDGAEASFLKFNKFGGEFFIKGENQVGVIMTLENGEDGVRVDVAEVDLNSD